MENNNTNHATGSSVVRATGSVRRARNCPQALWLTETRACYCSHSHSREAYDAAGQTDVFQLLPEAWYRLGLFCFSVLKPVGRRVWDDGGTTKRVGILLPVLLLVILYCSTQSAEFCEKQSLPGWVPTSTTPLAYPNGYLVRFISLSCRPLLLLLPPPGIVCT